jgi:S1-C subfamily serine protease
MSRKKIARHHLLTSKGFNRFLLTCVFAIIYVCGNFLATSTAYAAGVPGGNISNPVVRAVDIAKPAVVRILTTLGGRLTIHFTSTNSATFPQSGGSYKLQYLGSGAFISGNGDILTADHVIRPPHDASVDQDLYQLAAQDVADYINNNLNPPVPWTSNDAFSALSYGQLLSRSQYDTPASKVYLSTDFTGPTDVTTLDNMPQNAFADVSSILKESNSDNMDTAIIHVNINNTPSIKLGDSSNVEQQDELTIIGFPGNGDISNTGDPSTGFLTASVNKVYVSALKQNTGGAPLIQVGGNVEHGDSGGPALDSNGNIVGIVSFGGSDMPDGTSFLQASSSAQQLIDQIQLNTQPGAFQTAWNQVFNQYSSTQSGHWHLAQQQMEKLQSNYPNFHAIQPYLNYVNAQASKEKVSANNTVTASNFVFFIGIALIALVVIFLVVLLLFLVRRRKKPQAAIAAQPSLYQPAYNGSGSSSEVQPTFNSGSMVPIGQRNYENSGAGTMLDAQQAQQPSVQSTPQAPQTPTPVAASHFAQSGPMPSVQNRPPMNPQPQGAGYGSPPAYGQSNPYGYGQQPSRPVQGPPNNGGYPAQPQYAQYPPQQQYTPNGPYPQNPAQPWPPANTPPLRPAAPYAPQNPAQQSAPIQGGQRPPANGMPYTYGQNPQGYGTAPAPQPPQPWQLSQQSSASIPVQRQRVSVPPTPNEPTMRVSPQNSISAEETARSAEDKKSTTSSIPVLPNDQDPTATVLREQRSSANFSTDNGSEEEH